MKAMASLALSVLTGIGLIACGSDSGGGASDEPRSSETGSAPASNEPTPIGIGPCEGVRPGAPVFVEGNQCTLNFVYRDGNGTEYVGTAGHCVLGETGLGGENAGESVWGPGQGPEATDGAGDVIGRFAYAILAPPKDFALIRIANGVRSNPQSCHFGGPQGINTERSNEPTVLRYYGSGLAFGNLLPARSAVALSTSDPDEIFLTGAATPGDSGAGVLDTEGRAVGVLVTVGALLGSIGTEEVNAGTVGVTRLQPQLERARGVLGRPGLRLVEGALKP